MKKIVTLSSTKAIYNSANSIYCKVSDILIGRYYESKGSVMVEPRLVSDILWCSALVGQRLASGRKVRR